MRNRHLYPENWEDISLAVREKSGWTCQKCGKQCRKTGESIWEFVQRVKLSNLEITRHPIKWCLTVAHLNHEPSDCCEENLMAMCAPCHLKYDADHHVQTRKVNQIAHLERCGQLRLF